MVELIASPQGLFKGVPEASPRYVLLNKADTGERRDHAAAIVAGLLHQTGVHIERFITGALATVTVYGYSSLR